MTRAAVLDLRLRHRTARDDLVQRNILKGLGAKDQSQFSRGIANSADARGDAVAAFKKENV